MVREAGECRRDRARHAVRGADRPRADGRVCAGRRGRVTGPLHPAGARRGRLDHPAPVLPRQHRPGRAALRAGGAHPSPRPHRRRRGAVCVLRQADSRRGGVGAALRLVVEEGRSPGPDAADVHRGPAAVGPGRPGRHRRVPDDLEAGGPRPRRDVPVRAGQPRGRRHRARPRRGPEPGDRRRVRLAGARPARGPRHRADPQSCPRGSADCWCPRRSTRARWSGSCASAGLGPGDGLLTDVLGARGPGDATASPSAPRTGTSHGCRRTCGSTSPSRTLGAGSSPAARTSTRSARPPSPSCAGRCPAPGRRWSGPVCARGSSARSPRRSRTTSAAGRLVQGYPALVDDGDSRVAARAARPGPRRSPSTDSGCAGCCCSTSRRRGSGCWPASPTPRSSRSPTTRTGRFPRSSTTVSPAPSTRSPRNGCRGRSGRPRRSPRPWTRCGPTSRPGWSRSSGWSSRSSPRTSRRPAGSTP